MSTKYTSLLLGVALIAGFAVTGTAAIKSWGGAHGTQIVSAKETKSLVTTPVLPWFCQLVIVWSIAW
jgi:hypothetical protein